jgi:hypothetical protein
MHCFRLGHDLTTKQKKISASATFSEMFFSTDLLGCQCDGFTGLAFFRFASFFTSLFQGLCLLHRIQFQYSQRSRASSWQCGVGKWNEESTSQFTPWRTPGTISAEACSRHAESDISSHITDRFPNVLAATGATQGPQRQRTGDCGLDLGRHPRPSPRDCTLARHS